MLCDHKARPKRLLHEIDVCDTIALARKVRAAAIELGHEKRITLEYAEVRPGKKNSSYANSVNPLRKVPALILDDGSWSDWYEKIAARPRRQRTRPLNPTRS